ncbi:protein MAK11 [Paragonimus westermani]|uniref:Protein MAK11 n=1 Tax=Paragonimus westermani TaxID=34504 RepID=A0A5J4NPI8_9TREM|nr:protein MAK11 [Paragonimus westermani]
MKPSDATHVLLVACGTYDGSVVALSHTHTIVKKEGPAILKPVLLDPSAHNGAVSAIAIDGPILASGGTDEAIMLFSLPSQTRLGSLELHTGTVRHLEFAAKSSGSTVPHLFSAGDDGCIAIWRQTGTGISGPRQDSPSSWECIRALRRHKGPVISLAVHPSNRYAYSISEDKTFRIWNLLRGRQAYATRLKLVAPGAQTVLASPSGHRLLFIWPDRFELVDLTVAAASVNNKGLGSILTSVQFPQPTSACPVFFNEDDHDLQGVHKQPDDCAAKFIHILIGCGSTMTCVRCPTLSVKGSKPDLAQNFGEVRLPGKRIKMIRVILWPEALRTDDSHPHYGYRCRLVAAVTTESTGSHIRGYAINVNWPLEPGKSFIPVFAHDISSARVTTLAVDWMHQQSEESKDEMVVVESSPM